MVVDVSESKYIIGIIEFLDVIDESSVESSKRNVNIKKIGKCSVEVRDKEGPIPHMHIDSEDGSFKSCVCLHTQTCISPMTRSNMISSQIPSSFMISINGSGIQM